MILKNREFNHSKDHFHDAMNIPSYTRTRCRERIFFSAFSNALQRQELFERAIPIVKHNYDHFYNGGFEKILWTELTGMLNELATDLI